MFNFEFNNVIKQIRKQFLCTTPIARFNFCGIFNDITWEEQNVLVANTTNSSLVLKYPIKYTYQKNFLKLVIKTLENLNVEIHDSIYDSFGHLIALTDSCEPIYKHYELCDGKVITLKESPNIISEGTTGLCSWQASLVLSEWCLSNKFRFKNKTVLELGSGTGLTSLTVAVNCKPKRIYLTDCHESVLEALEENVRTNALMKDNDCAHVLKLPWELVSEQVCKQLGKVDFIIAADVVYDSELFKPLISAFEWFLSHETLEVVLACTERNAETLEGFLEGLETACLQFERLEVPDQRNFIWSDAVPVRIFSITKKFTDVCDV